jgi:hypothetical protein
LHVDPSSGLSLDFPPPRWVLVRGHLRDPAAETCHFVYAGDSTEERMPDAMAIESCRQGFVLVSYQDAP